MKSVFNLSAILVAALFSGAASASIDLNDYVLISAGFGIDGATNRSHPNPDSADLAAEIFRTIVLKADAKGKKVAGIQVQGETVGMESSADGFALMAVAKTADMKSMGGMNDEITIGGLIARAIFDSLPSPPGAPALGKEIRSVANLSCTILVIPSAPVTCTIKNTSFIAISLRDAVDESEGEFTEADAEELVNLSGV